mgnify:FL=1
MIDHRKHHTDNDPFADKREEKTLRNFKKVLKEMLRLLMRSTGSETVSLHWVNKFRQQFVLESYGTTFANTTFQDRIDFSQSFLDAYKDIDQPVQLEVGVDLPESALSHYFKQVPVQFVYILPFINNKETVGLTILESNRRISDVTAIDAIEAYQMALGHLLYTFIELSDLAKDEAQWYQYEEMLESIGTREDPALLIDHVMTQLQSFLQKGSVSMLCRTAGAWKVALNTAYSVNTPKIGTIMHENSLANEALKSGLPQFAIHFNHSPRRVSLSEPPSTGATLAIPLLMQDRRQAVFVVNDENPLLFKESVKHKMTNLVRILGLKMTSGRDGIRLDTDLFTNELGIVQPLLLERILHREIQRSALFPEVNSWLCMFTFDEINTIRTRYGVDVLKNLQRQIVKRTSVESGKISALTTFHADYIYFAVVQSELKDGVDIWVDLLRAKHPYQCQQDYIELNFKIATLSVDRNFRDASDVLSKIKRQFSELTRREPIREI